jgi:heat shock protein HslJ
MSMKTITVAAMLVAGLASCGLGPQKEPPPKPFVGTKWQVQLDLPLAGEQPYFRFGDGRMEGFGGCNRITARYVQDTVGARAIVIGRMDTGTRVCDGGAIEAEKGMLGVLQAVSSYTVTGDTMTMTGSAGTLKLRSDPPYEVKP